MPEPSPEEFAWRIKWMRGAGQVPAGATWTPPEPSDEGEPARDMFEMVKAISERQIQNVSRVPALVPIVFNPAVADDGWWTPSCDHSHRMVDVSTFDDSTAVSVCAYCGVRVRPDPLSCDHNVIDIVTWGKNSVLSICTRCGAHDPE